VSTTTLEIHYPSIKTGGAVLPPTIARKLVDLDVESTYNQPDLCLLRFDIDANEEIPAAFEIGKELEISFKAERAAVIVFKGEITALEFEGRYERTIYVVECQDKFHRFFRDDKTRTFLRRKVSEVAGTMASERGVGNAVVATTTQYDFLMQQNVSDGQWLLEQAAKRNYHVRVADGKLVFDKVGAAGDSNVALEWGKDLLAFNARVTGAAFLKEATVRGWDPSKKEAIVGQSTSASARKDPKVAQAPWNSSGKVSLVRTGDALAPAEATTIAGAVMERRNEHNLQAEGVCFGSPNLRVDKLVEIKGANTRFNGKYRVSHLRHRYSHEEGFMTEFACRGASDQSVVGVIQDAAGERAAVADRSIFDGVAIGLVTDNKDPQGLGRVKVKLPVLPQHQGVDTESDWMRMVFPGSGGEQHHGWYLLPEINDEVLVIFEQGDARRGYVLGGLLNTKDKPFYTNGAVIDSSGKVNQHVFRTKNGTHLLFEEKAGEEKVELIGKNGKGFHFKFDDSLGAVLTTKSGEVMTVTNQGDITIKTEGGKNITVDAGAGGNLTLTGKDITIDAKGKLTAKAAQDASVEGLNVKVNGQMGAEVKGGATAKLEASGQTVVKGAMVMIN
jgi:uncharacterized protein involved in type VI secretion and phage assembly